MAEAALNRLRYGGGGNCCLTAVLDSASKSLAVISIAVTLDGLEDLTSGGETM
jgi:hypothetical protein